MKEFISILKACPLFRDIDDTDLIAMLSCLGAKKSAYAKGHIIFHEGEPVRHIGIVLSGHAQIIRDDYYGNRSISAQLEQTDLFGESFAFAKATALPISVIAASDCQIMLIDASRIISPCSNACSFHNKLVYNLLTVMAQKNLLFHQKLEITSKRTTREKLMTFLMSQAKVHQSNSFTIPFDRQALADYLEVDRSGLSAEISKLRKEEIIECHRSKFTLL